MGGSAGSLEPLETFLHAVGSLSNAAVIVVTHRDPDAKELMVAILTRWSELPVREAVHGAQLERGVVYVVPADSEIDLPNGRIELRERTGAKRSRLTIDSLFLCLARRCGKRSIGVLLSGMGEDGTAGLAAVKRRLGLALVQSPASARYPSMPGAAIAAGLADVVGDATELARGLVAILEASSPERGTPTPATAIETVLGLVRQRAGHDFRSYKRTTIGRRIERRMALRRVAGVEAYIELLRREPEEIDRLLADLLIGVTRFFRDPDVFAKLSVALDLLLEGWLPGRQLRAWVAGCATGEEAYSLAMTIHEVWERKHPGVRLDAQIYATDLDATAIARARKGRYPRAIDKDVSTARLSRFFTADGDSYVVRPMVREMVVFALHNLISDPAFTRLDILLCRNVLIYLDADLQRRLLPLFACALAPGGLLVLGTSENLTGLDGTFSTIDGHAKIFRRWERGSVSPAAGRPPFPVGDRAPPGMPALALGFAARAKLPPAVEHQIVSHVAPPVAVVDAKGELLYASRRLGRYFEPPSGRSSLNVFAMAREGLALPLRSALRKAFARSTKVHVGVRIRHDGRELELDLAVVPLSDDLAGKALIAFSEQAPVREANPRPGRARKIDPDGALRELEQTKEQLDRVMREMDESQEVLQGMNEELQSANEELQSANEELTTSKEEMQSMNEELLTLNSELQTTNERLVITNDDMRNLLNSSQIPTLFLDNELRLKRYTAQAVRIARLLGSDVGRPITDIAWNIAYETLAVDVKEVLHSLVSKEAEVSSSDGSTYTMRIHPYRTVDDVIDGVVMTFMDVSAQKRAAARAVATERHALVEQVIALWPGIAYLENVATGRVALVSDATNELLGYSRNVLAGGTVELWQSLREPAGGDDDAPLATGPRAVKLRRRDGTLHDYRERALVVTREPNGEPRTILHLFRKLRMKRRP